MTARSFAATLLFVLAVAAPGQAAYVLNTLASYSQDFNFLHAASGPGSISWTNDQNPTTDIHGTPGWYWENVGTNAPYNRGNGTAGGGSPYSFRNTDSSTDRAMGSLSDPTSNSKTAWGVVLLNSSGQTIRSITVTYTGEQWRAGVSAADGLTFSYLQSSSNVTTMDPAGGAVLATPVAWTAVTALDFDDFGAGNPLHTGTASGTALNGNDAGNRFTMTATFNVTVPNLEYLALRWYDQDVTGADNSLATDDLSVSFSTAAVPEPGAAMFGGLVCSLVGLAAAVRRRLLK